MTGDEEVLYAPLPGFLRLLCQGWRLPSPWCGYLGHHGAYSVLLWRPAGGP